MVSETVVAEQTLSDRKACANALADGDLAASQLACALALEKLRAGFDE